HQFSNADLDETLDDIIDNKEEFQAKHGLTDEETDSALEHAILMKSMSPDEREAYLGELNKTNPRIAEAITNDAEENNIGGRENTFVKTETKVLTVEADDVMNSINSDSSFSDLEKPKSEITSTFRDEVNNVGANAQSFALDEAPRVTVIDKAPDPFVLDA
ncbi:MAG: hypothetical protein JKY11_06580, partial [Alphaproteobacteria bacterium]|nr:hypothetical protein [Alphaproteobacteria bacterium]